MLATYRLFAPSNPPGDISIVFAHNQMVPGSLDRTGWDRNETGNTETDEIVAEPDVGMGAFVHAHADLCPVFVTRSQEFLPSLSLRATVSFSPTDVFRDTHALSKSSLFLRSFTFTPTYTSMATPSPSPTAAATATSPPLSPTPAWELSDYFSQTATLEVEVVPVSRNRLACTGIAIGSGICVFLLPFLMLPIVRRYFLYDEMNYLKMDV
jgi:hypothetical protein